MKSIVWGNQDFEISQQFGVPGFRPDWYQYSADYGWPAGYHIGLDVAMPRGTKLYAAEGGTVIQAGMSDYFRPKPVWVLEDDGDIAIYGHMWENAVKEGDEIAPGQYLGISGEQTYPGTTVPDGSGPHLHFELRRPVEGQPGRYKAVDPAPELTGAQAETVEKTSTLLDSISIHENVKIAAFLIMVVGFSVGGLILATS